MPPALTPALAVDYVRELSADVRAAIVLDANGELLAGPAGLAAATRALLAAAGDAAELEVVTEDGVVCVVRSDRHTAVAVCGRFALPGVTRQDLRVAVAALDGEPAQPVATATETPPDSGLQETAEALISTVQRDFPA
jgi:hypothetical protein